MLYSRTHIQTRASVNRSRPDDSPQDEAVPDPSPQTRFAMELALAAQHGDLDRTRALLESGADASAHESLALALASGMGHLEVVDLLLDSGADPQAGDGRAREMALHRGHLEVAERLDRATDPRQSP